MLDRQKTSGADVPVSSLGVGHRLLEPLWTQLVFECCSASCLCAVLLCALRTHLRGLLALGAAYCVQGAETRA